VFLDCFLDNFCSRFLWHYLRVCCLDTKASISKAGVNQLRTADLEYSSTSHPFHNRSSRVQEPPQDTLFFLSYPSFIVNHWPEPLFSLWPSFELSESAGYKFNYTYIHYTYSKSIKYFLLPSSLLFRFCCFSKKIGLYSRKYNAYM